jgi:hypothetical protein
MSKKELEALIKSSGSVAQFLADKEKCKAVWGKEIKDYKIEGSLVSPFYLWQLCSDKAFQILQQEGEEACINYIKETMIK